LIIVDRSNIATQWIARAEEHLGYTPGLVGNGEHKEFDITIAMQQTLWAKREELFEDGFFDRWGFVCLDECHHLAAHTFTNVVQLFNSRYRIGVSGTPLMQKDLKEIVLSSVGPIFHETPKKELVDNGILVVPHVYIMETEFKHNFWPTHSGP